jgi:hypothetical protein
MKALYSQHSFVIPSIYICIINKHKKTKTMKKKLLVLLVAPMMILASCSKDKDEDMTPTETKASLELNFSNLAMVQADEQYEGWIIVNGSPLSTGTFTVDESGQLSQSTFEVDKSQLESATDFVLSIEPMPDSDPAPSDIKILGGGFNGNEASLGSDHAAALGHDFNNAMGKYILTTPTTSTMDDEKSGVWFLDLSSGSPMSGIDLPELPSNWKYEGWMVINGNPVSTGTFADVDMMDDAAPYSSMDAAGPPFPGEDMVSNAPSGLSFPIDLSGTTAVISIEPHPDNSPMPFAFKPLVGNVPTDALDHNTYDLSNNVSGSFPTGTAMR